MRWTRDLYKDRQSTSQEFSSAVVFEGEVGLVGSKQGTFYALNATNGAVLWKKKIGAMSTRATIDGAWVYLGTDDGNILCLSVLDGEERWRYTTDSAVLAPALVWKDHVFFATDSGNLFSLNKRSGGFVWKYSGEQVDEYALQGHAQPTRIANQVVQSFARGLVAGFSPKSGTLLWSQRVASPKQRFTDIDGTPSYGQGSIFVASGGHVYAVEGAVSEDTSGQKGEPALGQAATSILWKAPLAKARETIAYDNAVIAAGANSFVLRLSNTGEVDWRLSTHDFGVPSQITIDRDIVFVSYSKRGLLAIDVHTGRLLRLFDPGDGISSPPTVAGDDLFVVSNRGVLYTFGLYPRTTELR